MARAAATFTPITDGLRANGIDAGVTQTGGMCLAVEWPGPGGHFLLTDTQGPLSPEYTPESHRDGWLIGWYPHHPEADSLYDGGMAASWSTDENHVEAAVVLAMQATSETENT